MEEPDSTPNAPEQPLTSLRKATEADHAFIYNSWTNAQFYGFKPNRNIPDKAAFMRGLSIYIKKLLESPEVLVTVACVTDDPEIILGYSVMERTCLYWVFVKEPFRLQGIAKRLVFPCSDGMTVTSTTTTSQKIKHDFTFNPFYIYSVFGKEEK